MKVRVIGSSGRMGQIHCRTYRDLGLEIVESGEDIVSIASPDQTHGNYVLNALADSKHVFCEKPLCTKLEELEDIEAISAIRPPLHVGQNFPLRYVFDRDKVNWIGAVYRADATYDWARTFKLGKEWRTDGYSLVMGGLIHMADLMIWMLGDLDLISAAGVNESAPEFNGPDTIVTLCHSRTAIVSLIMDGGSGPRVHAHRLNFWGTGGHWHPANTLPTDKSLAIKDFVKNLGNPPRNDFRATRLCLEIDECLQLSN